ncbi:Adenylyl-sulfate kinase [Magnetospirillum sp. LM-5]|uniref:adenylyl-sulfate kinase n=1 Tax=Magnetospirillum sp. LM-5 TaxID=2681466 RepID=UPI00137DCDE0|nr:adenylyl-sulfate kinase [Magnetospirillum sp. LM-5]CAA7613727.1 Adenylyl-sulfate kinase [Magnetospirillum sp. LM-5]
MPNRVGAVIWITGLSGAGKSTLGHLVWNALKEAGQPALYLDGDVLREMLGAVDAHGPDQRLALAHTYGRMCKVLAEQGAVVVCSTISMFHAVRRWNRDHIPGYVEIYLKVPLDELVRRDPKGLYAKGVNMQGLDLPFEEPEAPDLVIDNFGATAPDQAVNLILDHLKGHPS